MTGFEIAQAFFAACEKPLGWEGCHELVAQDATFSAQSEPVADLTTVEDYSNWMYAFGTVTAPGCSYTLHNKAWDADTNTALFFATFHGTHSGDGGPVAPTGQSTNSHYVYTVTVNADNKVSAVTKIWNAPWAMRELGWT